MSAKTKFLALGLLLILVNMPSIANEERVVEKAFVLEFKGSNVSGMPQTVQGTALIKNLKKTTLILIRNTGGMGISSLFMKVDTGMIEYVWAKDWERSRLDDDTVMLRSGKEVAQNRFVLVLKWKDKPELESITIPLLPMPEGSIEEELKKSRESMAPIRIYAKYTPLQAKPEIVRLGEGQNFQGLEVNKIYKEENDVSVDVTSCWGPACIFGPVHNKVMKVGDTVTFACDLDATLIAIEGSLAVFGIKEAHKWQCMVL